MKGSSSYSVTGPGVERTSGLESEGMAVSFALTHATRSWDGEETFYVRDPQGVTALHVVRRDRVVFVVRRGEES